MKTSIQVRDALSPEGITVSARRVVYDVLSMGRLPLCAWCRLNPLRPLTDIIQHGFTVDLVQTVCVCDQCHKGTIVEYEIQRETESEVK